MQVLANALVSLKEGMDDKQQVVIESLVDQLSLELDQFITCSATDIDSLDQAMLAKLVDQADQIETQWIELEQRLRTRTCRGEQVQRELVVAYYRARFVGLKHEVEQSQLAAQEGSRPDQQSISRSLVRVQEGLSSLEAKIEKLEASHLDGWRALRQGLHQALQRLEKQVSTIQDHLR